MEPSATHNRWGKRTETIFISMRIWSVVSMPLFGQYGVVCLQKRLDAGGGDWGTVIVICNCRYIWITHIECMYRATVNVVDLRDAGNGRLEISWNLLSEESSSYLTMGTYNYLFLYCFVNTIQGLIT